ncbi:MAG: hypothetical protein R8N23_00670 [Reichenbachiella sp.]|uniref:hypothetical protein n=1 Tax=Reichenbachiella sp. TaxID=2184521 RepID=UPI00296646CE|nr:hypothetical protein [Reichenbachiella sp.]MDW3208347.1 hypothetical protein [Reichenbachiella sp.]
MLRTLFILLVFGISCVEQQGSSDSLSLERTELQELKKANIWNKVEINSEKADVTPTDENLFGKFYNDRIEFHIIDEPDIKIHNAEVTKVTLYYIDSVLCKKKYELDRPIPDELAKTYGKLSYKSLNFATDSLARHMGIVLRSENGNRLNPYLEKYQLKWKLEEKVIYFRHLEDSLGSSNFYIEELKEYRRLFNSVQRDLI